MIESTRKYALGVGAVLLSATCFAGTSILFKVAYRIGLTPAMTLALQSWFSSVILIVYNATFNRQVFRINRRMLPVLTFQGLVGTLGTSLIYAYALKYLPVSVAILLLYLYPSLVMAAEILVWHRRVRVNQIWALLLTLAGTLLASGILSGWGRVPVTGVIFGLGAAVCYALFNLVGEVVVKRISPLAGMSFAQWFSSLGLIVYLGSNVVKLPWRDSQTWIIGLALATIASIFPFYLVLVGIKLIGASRAAIMSTFELPMTFVMAALFLAEIPQWNQWAGGLLVLLGVAILNWRTSDDGEDT